MAQIPRLESEGGADAGADAGATFIKTVQFGLNGFHQSDLSRLSAAPAAPVPLLSIPVVPVTVINPSISYRAALHFTLPSTPHSTVGAEMGMNLG